MKRLLGVLCMRCPACLKGRLFAGLVRMHPRCPVCGLTFEREPGYFLGAMVFSYAIAIVICAGLFLVVRRFTSTTSPILLIYMLILYLPLVPFVFRFSRVLWIYLDQTVDPS
jgi:uncharacterized protein (DUF983 family)